MLKLSGVSKKIGKVEVLKDISFTLGLGQIKCIFGPSGSGKTTILRIIAGLEDFDSGAVFFDNQKLSNPKIVVDVSQRGFGFVFQDLALWPHMTALEHLRFVLESKKVDKDEQKEEIERLFNLVKLPMGLKNRLPFELSGGEKQRLAIARSLAQNPKLLLMDEPVSSLDEMIKEEILENILTLQKQLGISLLYVSHDLSEILRLTTDIIILNEGEVKYQGPALEIAENDDPLLKRIRKSAKEMLSK